MSIDNYVAQLESVINSSPLVSSYNVTIDRKTNDIAFVSGTIELRDGIIHYGDMFLNSAPLLSLITEGLGSFTEL